MAGARYFRPPFCTARDNRGVPATPLARCQCHLRLGEASTLRAGLVRRRLGDDLIVRLAGVLVRGPGVVHLVGGVGALLGPPALVDALAAPLGAPLARADRLVVDEDEDRVGVA